MDNHMQLAFVPGKFEWPTAAAQLRSLLVDGTVTFAKEGRVVAIGDKVTVNIGEAGALKGVIVGVEDGECTVSLLEAVE